MVLRSWLLVRRWCLLILWLVLRLVRRLVLRLVRRLVLRLVLGGALVLRLLLLRRGVRSLRRCLLRVCRGVVVHHNNWLVRGRVATCYRGHIHVLVLIQPVALDKTTALHKRSSETPRQGARCMPHAANEQPGATYVEQHHNDLRGHQHIGTRSGDTKLDDRSVWLLEAVVLEVVVQVGDVDDKEDRHHQVAQCSEGTAAAEAA